MLRAVVAAAVAVLSALVANGGGPRSTTTTTVAATTTTTTPAPRVVVVPYRIDRRTDDPATDDFGWLVTATLEDPRGWQQASFDLRADPDAHFVIVLAEGDEVDRLCLPHDTYGTYSCQRENVVAINADRWRTATPKWTGDLATYKEMLVNHEVGHLLGQAHRRCEREGAPAAVMVQQSTELNGCTPNPWPLPDEIERAARHDRPLAPL